MKNFCPFCNKIMREVIDSHYPKVQTYLCYECGYSIDETMIENKDLLTAYEQTYFRFKDILKPVDLLRYQPIGNTNNNSREDNSTIFSVLLQYQLTNTDNSYLINKQVILASYRIMEKNHTEKKMEQLLKDEKEKLLSEIQNRVEKKKSLIKNDEEISYRKRRF